MIMMHTRERRYSKPGADHLQAWSSNLQAHALTPPRNLKNGQGPQVAATSRFQRWAIPLIVHSRGKAAFQPCCSKSSARSRQTISPHLKLTLVPWPSTMDD